MGEKDKRYTMAEEKTAKAVLKMGIPVTMGKPLYAFGITIVRQLVLYIPFLLLFNAFWGYNGLIHAQPVEECICMVFSLTLLFRKLRKEI